MYFLSKRWLLVVLIKLTLEFLKALFFFPTLYVLYINGLPYYTLMAFLMMLSVISLSILMILLSTLSMIRHLICGNNLNWLLNLNLVSQSLCTGAGSGLFISMSRKSNWFCLTGLITLVRLM